MQVNYAPDKETDVQPDVNVNRTVWYQNLLDRDLVPDWLIRLGIRRLLAARLKQETKKNTTAHRNALLSELKVSPIALHTDSANNQHYQVPTPFFQLVLGKRLKYSCNYWPNGVTNLDESEEAALKLICERAKIADGQTILELGCGWGSLSLYLAAQYPNCEITALSNSATQKRQIDSMSAQLKITNLKVITSDINAFDPNGKFDRIVSIEMFEHVRNYQELMRRISIWMKPQSLLFIHIFSHKDLTYFFEDAGPNDWMARNFFTGGIMPSADLLLHFQEELKLAQRWQLPGTHYERTSAAWLKNMTRNRSKILDLFDSSDHPREAVRRWVQWRIFFMACAELFGYRGGSEWIISHYLFETKTGERTH